MADLTAQNKWEPLATDNSDREKIWSKSRTFAGDVWFRFRRKPTAIAGFVIIIALMLFALVGPLFTPYDYSVQNLEVVNVPPVMKVYQIPNGDYLYITTALKVISVTPDGKLSGQLRKVRDESDKSMTIFDADGTEVALYYGGSPYVIADEATGSIYPSKTMLNKSYILGTDALGRDVLTRLMYGGRVSLIIGFIVVAIEGSIGIVMGGISGYFGGWVDNLIMRIVDVFYCLPSMPIIIILGAAMDAMRIDSWTRMMYLMLILGFLGWPGIARLVRGQILSLREQEFMTAAEACGISAWHRIFRHLIPNVIPQLIVTCTMSLGSTILTEATLSFLGLGVKYPFASWGNIINDVNNAYVMTNYLFIWVPAGICLLITVLGFNFVGDGLRDAFDPKMKR